jgi:hypothetical protein
MNSQQRVWWEQAQSDHAAFVVVRGHGLAPCHALHYLQMVTEKLAKAYFWRSGSPPPRSHAGFVQFLRFLAHIRPADQERIAHLFTFRRYTDFQNWIRKSLPMAYELEHLAPALANGPNPEYPWPHTKPEHAPANYRFPIWTTLASGQGRDFMRIVMLAVSRFPEYADT